jgi:hypothetical protein
MVDYLPGVSNPASVPGIRLICIALARYGSMSRTQLERSLRPREYLANSSGEGSTFPASLTVGTDLGLLIRSDEGEAIYSLGPVFDSVADSIAGTACASAFLPIICASVNERAMSCAVRGEVPSDVARTLTWLLGRDPLASLQWEHSGPTDAELARSGMASVVDNKSQWNAMRRWFVELGYAAVLTSPRKKVLSMSVAPALVRFLSTTKGSIPGTQFVSELLQKEPVLGHPKLVEALPLAGRHVWDGSTSSAIAEGLLQLEAKGLARLHPGDDSEYAIRLAFGDEAPRVIRAVEWLGGGGQ